MTTILTPPRSLDNDNVAAAAPPADPSPGSNGTAPHRTGGGKSTGGNAPQFDMDRERAEMANWWASFFASRVGIDDDYLTTDHRDCPKCGGKDRYRVFNDFATTGGMLCNQCGKFADGFAATEWLLGVKFPEAVQMAREFRGADLSDGGSQKKATPKPPETLTPSEPDKPRPSQVELLTDYYDMSLRRWCSLRPCRSLEILHAIGGRLARFKPAMTSYVVTAVPIIGESLLPDEPVGWWVAEIGGEKLPVKGGELVKHRVTAGSGQGIIASPRLLAILQSGESLENQWVIKVEGIGDLIALLMVDPEALAWTNAHGSKETPYPWLLDLFTQCNASRAAVIHDCDDAGVDGALGWTEDRGKYRPGWASALATVVDDVRNINLPYPIADSDGKDLRDWLVEHHVGEDGAIDKAAAADGLAQMIESAARVEPADAAAMADVAASQPDDEAAAREGGSADAGTPTEKSSLPSFAGIDAAELSQYVDEETDWLVDGIFAADQPTVFGAASKATKTTQLVDLSVALATKTPWLNSFAVSKRRKVLFITGESNYRSASKRVHRALKSRSLKWSDVAGILRVEAIEFPNFPSALHRQGIASDVKTHGFEVVIIDPLYRGLQGLDTFRMAEMGEAIIQFVKCCQPASVIISHHVVKAAAKEMGPPALEDLSGAGLAESAGNWWLLGRNEPYKFDRRHDLSVVFGGRDEQAGIKRIVFDESEWTFEVSCGQDIREQRKRESAEREQKARESKIREARAGIKHALANEKEAKAKSWIESRSGHPQTVTRVAIAEMLVDQTLVEQPYTDAIGRQHMGIILASMAAVDTDPHRDAR